MRSLVGASDGNLNTSQRARRALRKNYSPQPKELAMGKAMDTKKDSKKKPAKSLMEKRAAKKEKKENKGYRG
jgi:hypothetical protein